MNTKTSQALAFFKAGQLKQAFRIFKTFSGRISVNDKRTIEIAYESLTGHADFYAMLGINTDDMINEAVAIIKSVYAI